MKDKVTFYKREVTHKDFCRSSNPESKETRFNLFEFRRS